MAGHNPLKSSIYLTFKVALLETLNVTGDVEARASGFLIQEPDGLFLYTCWHVVTGIDFLSLEIVRPPTRRKIRIFLQSFERRNAAVTTIGHKQSIEIDLYNVDGYPRWAQEDNHRENCDLNQIGIFVPKFFDVVRIPLSVDDVTSEFAPFHPADVNSQLNTVGNDMLIAGFPYGYSAMEKDSPEPIFLKRAIASSRVQNVGRTLLDGIGVQGMSGGPVLTFHTDRWWLAGMYTGAIFPDADFIEKRKKKNPDLKIENDRFAAIGTFANINIARAFLNVPPNPADVSHG